MPETVHPAIPGKVTLTNAQLHDLLKPILPFTDTVYSLPILETILVHFIAESNYLVASATNRYHLGIKRVKVQAEDVASFATLVPASEARRILALFKPSRRAGVIRQPRLTLEVADSKLIAEAVPAGNATDPHTLGEIKVTTTPGGNVAGYPDLFELVERRLMTTPALNPARLSGTTAIGFNPGYLAAIEEAARCAGNPGIPVVFTVPATPAEATLAQVGDDFLAVFMPVRLTTHADREPPLHEAAAASWKPLIGALQTNHQHYKRLAAKQAAELEAKAKQEANV